MVRVAADPRRYALLFTLGLLALGGLSIVAAVRSDTATGEVVGYVCAALVVLCAILVLRARRRIPKGFRIGEGQDTSPDALRAAMEEHRRKMDS